MATAASAPVARADIADAAALRSPRHMPDK
jgi:hypothetical protein